MTKATRGRAFRAAEVILVSIAALLPLTSAERHVSAGKDAICAVKVESTQGITCVGTDWVDTKTGPFHAVAAGDGFTCGLSTTHRLSCWKRTGETRDTVPTGVDTTSAFIDLVAGEDHMCGLKPSGEAVCFRSGATAATQPSPASSRFVSLSADKDVTCGITRPTSNSATDGGEILCWSQNATASVFVASKPAGPFIDVAVGANHACALACDGTASCWGPDTAAYQSFLSKGNGKFLYLSAGGGDTCGIERQTSGSSKKVRCSSDALSYSLAADALEVSVGARGAIMLSTTPALFVNATGDPLKVGYIKASPASTGRAGPVACNVDCMTFFGVTNSTSLVSVTVDGGASFSTSAGITNATGFAVSGNGNVLYALKRGEYLKRSVKGDNNFQQSNTIDSSSADFGVNKAWTGIVSNFDGTKYLLAEYGGRLRLSTGEIQSAAFSDGVSIRNWQAVAASGSFTRFFAAAEGGQIWVSTDGGASWTGKGPVKAWRAVAASLDGMTVLAAPRDVSADVLYLSKDGGITYSAISSGPSKLWTSVAMTIDGKLMAAGHKDGVYRSYDGGTTWVQETITGASGSEYYVAISATGDRLVIGAANGIYYSTPVCLTTGTSCTANNGQTWRTGAAGADDAIMFPRATSVYYDTSTNIDVTTVKTIGHGPMPTYSLKLNMGALTRITVGTFSANGRCMVGIDSLTLVSSATALQLRNRDLLALRGLKKLVKNGAVKQAENTISLAGFDSVYSGAPGTFSLDSLEGLDSATAVWLGSDIKTLDTMTVKLPSLVKIGLDAGTDLLQLKSKPFWGASGLTAFGQATKTALGALSVPEGIDLDSPRKCWSGVTGQLSLDALEGLQATKVTIGSNVRVLQNMTIALPTVTELRVAIGTGGAEATELRDAPFRGLTSLQVLQAGTEATSVPNLNYVDLTALSTYVAEPSTFDFGVFEGLRPQRIALGSNVRRLCGNSTVPAALLTVTSISLATSATDLELFGQPFAGLTALTGFGSSLTMPAASFTSFDLSSFQTYVGLQGSFSFDALKGIQATKVVLGGNLRQLAGMTISLPSVTEVRVATSGVEDLGLVGLPFSGLPALTSFGSVGGPATTFDLSPFRAFVGQQGAFNFDALVGLASVTALRLPSSVGTLETMTATLNAVQSLSLSTNPSGLLLKTRAFQGFPNLTIINSGGSEQAMALNGLNLATSVGGDGTRYLNLSVILSSAPLRSASIIDIENNGAVIVPVTLGDGPFLKLTQLRFCAGNYRTAPFFETSGGLTLFPNVTIFTASNPSDIVGVRNTQREFRANGCGARAFLPTAFSPLADNWRSSLLSIRLNGNLVEDHKVWLNITLSPTLTQEVDLSSNSILEIHPPGFESATLLRTLLLSDNPLAFLDSQAFSFDVNRAVQTVTFLNTGLLTANCPAGMYSSVFSFASGGRCPACFRCGPGAYCPGNNKQMMCPRGTFSNQDEAVSSSVCKPCPAGTYQELQGQSRLGCVGCAAGFYSSTAGAPSSTVCLQCERGRYAAEGGKSTCATCAPGRYHRDGAPLPADNPEECVPCAKGRYSSTSGSLNSTFCAACRSGFTTAVEGAVSEDDCSVDTRRGCGLGLGWDEALSACRPCRAGFYGSAGLLGCQPCPKGTFWQAPAAHTGRVSGGLETCTRCPSDRFSVALNATSSSVCQACAFGFRPSEEGSGCVGCPQGQIPTANASAPFGFVCTTCASGPDAAVCAAGVTVPLPKSSTIATGMGSLASSLRSVSIPRGRLLAAASSSGAYTTTIIPATTLQLELVAGNTTEVTLEDEPVPPPRYSIVDSDTASLQNKISPAVSDFAGSAYGLTATVAMVSVIPVLLMLIPSCRNFYARIKRIDQFNKDRPLKDGDAVYQFSSPLGAGISCSYFFGMIGGSIVLTLAWVSDNAAYVSALRPIPPSFPWSKVGVASPNAPLEFSLGFAADSTATCLGLQMVSSSAYALPTAKAFTLVPPTTTAGDPTLCGVQVAFPSVAQSGNGIVANVSLVLPPSSQAMAFAVSGLLTTTSALKAGSDASVVWVSQAVETASSAATFGIASVDITLSVTAVMEEDSITGKTTYGLLVLGASTVVNERTTAEIQPGVDFVTVNVMAVPTQQFLSISVSQRSTVTELLAGMIGLLSGISVFYKMFYSYLYHVVRLAYGEPSWEKEAKDRHHLRLTSQHREPTSILAKALRYAASTKVLGGSHGKVNAGNATDAADGKPKRPAPPPSHFAILSVSPVSVRPRPAVIAEEPSPSLDDDADDRSGDESPPSTGRRSPVSIAPEPGLGAGRRLPPINNVAGSRAGHKPAPVPVEALSSPVDALLVNPLRRNSGVARVDNNNNNNNAEEPAAAGREEVV